MLPLHFNLIFSNDIINATVLAWTIAQILKFFTFYGSEQKFRLSSLFTSGGMPSSHSAGMMAMSVMVFRICGFSSPEFAVSIIISIIVMYDARGVRRATGEHATIINKMMGLYSNGESVFGDKYLKELIGHTPFQVLMGALLGVVVGLFYRI